MLTNTIRGLWILVCTALVPIHVLAQSENLYTKMTVEQLAEHWLQLNCGIDDEPLVVRAIKLRSKELAPVFRRSLETGPSAKTIDEVEQAAAQRAERRQAVLEDAPEMTGLSPEDLKRAQARNRDAYVQRSRNNFIVAYRGQALSGLHLVDPDGTKSTLEQLSSDNTSPLQGTARALLGRTE